jgi:ureidoacrylate peracid hydrolase
VASVGGEIVILKTASAIFNATNIECVLRNLGIESLEAYGIVTDQCVETAVRDAADRGVLVMQVENCCRRAIGTPRWLDRGHARPLLLHPYDR